MQRSRLRRCIVPIAATLAIVVGLVQTQLAHSVRTSGDSWGAAVAAIGLTILILWALIALPWVGKAAPPSREREATPSPPRIHQSAAEDAIGAFVGWLLQVVSLILVLGVIVGGIAWVAVRVYRLLP